MAVIEHLDQHYVDTQLRCPEGIRQVELVDPQRTGLYILVRGSSPGEGTYFLRYKDGAGKTCHEKIGRTTELKLENARDKAKRLKETLGARKSVATAETSLTRTVVAAPARPVNLAAELPMASGATMSLDTFMTEQYFPYIKERKRSAARDEQLYRLRIKARFGHLPLSGIKRREVERFGDELVEGGQSHASANQHMQLLRRVCKLAVGWDLLERYPLNGMKLFHLDNQRNTYLNDEEVTRLVEVLKTHDNRNVSLIIMFLLSTGARLREGLCAEWKQVDLTTKTWTIPATNSKSKRMKHLPLNVSALWVISQLTSQGKSRYLFPSTAKDKPYTTITRAWYVIRRKANLPLNFRIHDLRHTFASRLLANGMSLFDVQTLLGHADPRTSNRYAHPSMERAQRASNAAAFAVT